MTATLSLMWLVTPADVSAHDFARMVRDGHLAELLPGIALPRDVDDAPPVRRHALTRELPTGAQVTGLAALWAHGMAPVPHYIDVRTARGRMRRARPPGLPMVVHDVGVVGSGRVAPPGLALADALHWCDPDLVVPAALCVLDRGLCAPGEVEDLLVRRRASPERRAAARERWRQVRRAWERVQSTERLAPVMRLAS